MRRGRKQGSQLDRREIPEECFPFQTSSSGRESSLHLHIVVVFYKVLVGEVMSSCTRVTAGPDKKHHCGCGNKANSRDRLINLPEDVLGNILSCLPIKAAVRTCVLSKDWKLKWTLTHNVDLILFQGSPNEKDGDNFFNIVERVLSHLQCVRGLSLLCNSWGVTGVGHMISMISSILGRNIDNLELGLHDDSEVIILPDSILNCSNVRIMFLAYAMFRVPARTCFLSLKRLTLFLIRILNENSNTDTIRFTLPLLETLQLDLCEWLNVKFVEFDAPSLTEFGSSSSLEWDENRHYYSIKLVGARLAKLETIADPYPENIILTGSTVVQACLRFYTSLEADNFLLLEKCGLHVRNFLRELSDVKCLEIEHSQPLIGRTKLGLPLPRFHRLEKLHVLACHETYFDGEGLLELLHAAPFLKCLDVLMDKDDYNYELVEPLPTCIVNQLEQVKVKYTGRCTKPTLGFEKFLLKNGLQLKTISISALTNSGERVFSREIEIMEQLSTFPKGSTGLTIYSEGSNGNS